MGMSKLAIATSLVLGAGPGVAWGQNAADKAAADTLFDEGKRLIGKGDVAAACDKFEASLGKVVQLGTQIALASCYEKLGRTASAWGEFRAAAGAAAKAHDRRQDFAEKHAAALEGKLSKIAVVVIANRADGLEIRRDGNEVPAAELGTPVPVDPGEHTVEASAPGRVPWSIKVAVPATPGVVDVPIPALERDAARPPDPPRVAVTPPSPVPDDDPGAARHHRRVLAYGIGGGGVAVVGVALIFGALASSKWSSAKPHCPADRCDPTGFDLAGSAHTLGNVATGTFVVGLGALAAGAILLATAPSGTEVAPSTSAAAFHVTPVIGAAQLGLSLQGGF
jgi:hypothetical protein